MAERPRFVQWYQFFPRYKPGENRLAILMQIYPISSYPNRRISLRPDKIGNGGEGQVVRARQLEEGVLSEIVAAKIVRVEGEYVGSKIPANLWDTIYFEEDQVALRGLVNDHRIREELVSNADARGEEPVVPRPVSYTEPFVTKGPVLSEDGKSNTIIIEAHSVMEYIKGPSLAHLIEKDPKRVTNNAAMYFGNMLQAVRTIHRDGIIHLDLKPENFLINEQGNIKICDFSFAVKTGDPATHGSGTVPYSPPERMINPHGKVSETTDTFALGVIFYEMMTGEKVSSLMTELALQAQVRKGTLAAYLAGRMQIKGIEKPYREFLQKALATSPGERFQDVPSMLEAFNEKHAQATQLVQQNYSQRAQR